MLVAKSLVEPYRLMDGSLDRLDRAGSASRPRVKQFSETDTTPCDSMPQRERRPASLSLADVVVGLLPALEHSMHGLLPQVRGVLRGGFLAAGAGFLVSTKRRAPLRARTSRRRRSSWRGSSSACGTTGSICAPRSGYRHGQTHQRHPRQDCRCHPRPCSPPFLLSFCAFCALSSPRERNRVSQVRFLAGRKARGRPWCGWPPQSPTRCTRRVHDTQFNAVQPPTTRSSSPASTWGFSKSPGHSIDLHQFDSRHPLLCRMAVDLRFAGWRQTGPFPWVHLWVHG